jgi:hypothetical protein
MARPLSENLGERVSSGGITKRRVFTVLWCDSEAVDTGCRVLSGIGKWQGDDFVLTDQHGDSGKRVFIREVLVRFEAWLVYANYLSGRLCGQSEKGFDY